MLYDNQEKNRPFDAQQGEQAGDDTIRSDATNQQADENQAYQNKARYYQFGENPNGSSASGTSQQTNAGAGYTQQEYSFRFDQQPAGAQPPQKPKKKNKGVVVFASILAGIVLMGFAVFAVYGAYTMFQNNFTQPDSSQSGSSSAAVDSNLTLVDRPNESTGESGDGGMSTEDIVTKVQPSVVGIQAYEGVMSFTPASEGSGIIMSADGYIITNAHVVNGADGITVILDNGETYAAVLVGIDIKTDLAVLKIEAQNLTYAEFGNSDQLQVGERVVAIGNPGGQQFAGSTTQGIISALDRTVQTQIDDTIVSMECIQTDAAINPGNSGGALINKFGQVIGINSSKFVAEGYEGIGFAIPINDAKPIIDDLIAHGRVTGRVAIGFSGIEVTQALAQYNNVPMGLFVSSIQEGSDLITKGVAAGDIITQINGEDVTTFDQVQTLLEDKKPGDTITMTVYRQSSLGSGTGQTFTVEITLMEDVSGTVGTQKVTQ